METPNCWRPSAGTRLIRRSGRNCGAAPDIAGYFEWVKQNQDGHPGKGGCPVLDTTDFQNIPSSGTIFLPNIANCIGTNTNSVSHWLTMTSV